MSNTSELPQRVYGDWEWDEKTNRPRNIYPARITSRWSGGVEFVTDRATVERMIEAQARLDEKWEVDGLAWDGDVLVLTSSQDNEVYRYEPDERGMYPCGFGWTWCEWTAEDEEEHPLSSLAPGEWLDINVGPADDRSSMTVRIGLGVNADGEPFLSVTGVNIDLEGENPGEYYFAPDGSIAARMRGES